VRTVRTGEPLAFALAPAFAETIEVAAIRAEEATPVTKTDVSREQIEREYHGQDVPHLLRDAPGLTAFSESGVGGSGYSYISLRGAPHSRINFTLDGVPLSDSEDMGVYFVDFPDLARSLESVQIQRGVGTSTFGTAAFAGAVNMESVAHAQEARTEATLGTGSFGNQQTSVGWHSGPLANGFSLYTRASFLQNEGYRENSSTRQRNIFFSGAKQIGDDAQLKITGFTGREWMESSYYATDADTLRVNRRANPLKPEEKDSFGYDLAQVQYIRALDAGSNMTASAYYQRGYGWYRLYSSSTGNLREYGLDGMLLGGMLTFSKKIGNVSTNYGVHANHFKRDHTRDDLTVGVRNYANYGVKREVNAFAKATWESGPWAVYGDAQVRRSSFDYTGSVDIAPIDWTFFNPKAGVRYALRAGSSVYASAGIATREPTRNDLFLGEDNPSVAHDLHAVRPERVVNFELGWEYRTPRLDVSANLYAMEFRNEIAATGEQSEIGLTLRRNVDDSYRRGIELDVAYQALESLRLRARANLSNNQIDSWTQFYEVYDENWEWAGTRPVTYGGVEPLLTPAVILNAGFDYTPLPKLTLGAVGRYVGRSYLDNTNNEDLVTPAYFVADANISYAVSDWARISLQVNNVFDNDEINSSGYDWIYFQGEQLAGTAYYYPQATRNATVLLDLRF
ncbi:MAG: TonB-dependent receptor, partial [Thermoanaerobaculia bacterium]